MPREHESYRDNLELIADRYPGKVMLNIAEVSELLGICRNTVKKTIPMNGHYISTPVLARWMCGKN